MDVGNKTLSQLSDEAKEKRYVSLEVGAKISGYTKEYLDHLCRVNKVEYRQWNNGQFVVELDSLLAETQTLLLSYEDINFVDKKELLDDTPEDTVNTLATERAKNLDEHNTGLTGSAQLFSENNANGITQNIPTFGNANRTQGASPFSFVGRVVVSDPMHRDNVAEAEVRIPISLGNVPTQINTEAVEAPSLKPTPESPVKLPEAPLALTHSLGQVTRNPIVHYTVSEVDYDKSLKNKGQENIKENKKDDWDATLLGHNAPTPTTPAIVASPLHPIRTSVDPSLHHENLPLFPLVGSPLSGRDSVEKKPKVHNAIHHAPVVPNVSKPVAIATTGTLIFATPPSPGVTPANSVISSNKQKQPSTIPSIKVMPILPMEAPTLSVRTNEEHHLILREKYPLIKSVGFNAAIALFMLGSSVLLWTGVMANTPIFNNPNSYTAAVGDALPPTAPAVATSTAILPFSDEVTITRNKEENAVLVQPVFRDAMSTDTYEYTVVPHKEVEIIGVGE